MIRNPTAEAHGRASDTLVNFVEIHPALCNLTGLPAPEPLHGTSLAPLLNDLAAKVKNAAFRRFPRTHESLVCMGYSIGTNHHRYVDIQAYLASIYFADAMLGLVLDVLERGPNGDTTIIMLWSDHGWHLGEKDHWQKFTGWRACTHAPLIIRVPPGSSVLPEGTQPASVCDQAVSIVDLFPPWSISANFRRRMLKVSPPKISSPCSVILKPPGPMPLSPNSAIPLNMPSAPVTGATFITATTPPASPPQNAPPFAMP